MICTLTQGSISPGELCLKLKKQAEAIFYNGARAEQNIGMWGGAVVGKNS